MTYETLEESHESGEPVEVYDFTRNGTNIGRYTSADAAVTVGVNSYAVWPGGLKRGPIALAGDQGRNSLKITTAADFPPAQLIHLRSRTGIVGITVRRYHRSDASDIKPIWAGRILSARRGKTGERQLVCEPRSVTQNRIGLHRICQPGCNLELYGPQCRLSMAAWGHATTIAAISGNVLTVASAASTPVGINYAGGIVAFTDDDGITDYAFVEEVTGLAFTLDLALYGAAVSDAVTIYPGCDWTMATCHGVFNNAVNFGGRLNVPDKNPVTTSAFN